MTSARDYDATVTELCERALVTVIGNAGFWRRHLYLVGGLVPRYLVAPGPSAAPAHVGSRDVDLAVVLAVDSAPAGAYETLEKNLRNSGFQQAPGDDDPEFRWRREIDGHSLVLEFLCDTDEVPAGRNFKPRSGSGSRFQAFNVPGVHCVRADHRLVEIEAERLDTGGRSKVTVRVAGLMTFATLKITAFVDRHHEKDVYDLVYTLLNHLDGPSGAGRAMASSAVASDPFVVDAIAILRERFADARNDAPAAYATFMGLTDDIEAAARLRNEALETVRLTLDAYDAARQDSS